MASIFNTGGVPSIGIFTQPTIPSVGGCVAYEGCGTGYDPDAHNAIRKELLNLTDKAGIAWECGRLDNVANAVCAIISSRVACGNAGPAVVVQDTLPPGGTWMVYISASGTNAPNEGNFVNNGTIFGNSDDNTEANACLMLPGGSVIRQTGGDNKRIKLTWFAIRVDC